MCQVCCQVPYKPHLIFDDKSSKGLSNLPSKAKLGFKSRRHITTMYFLVREPGFSQDPPVGLEAVLSENIN